MASAAPGILTVEGVVAFILALVMLYRYGNLRKQNPLITGTTLLIWFLSFFIVFLLPIDVTSSFYHNCLENVECKNATEDNDNNTQCCIDYGCSDSTPYQEEQCNGHCRKSASFICEPPLKIMWNIIYWLFAVFTWVILPLAQSYVLASYFSIRKKIIRALIENIIVYLTLLVIFTIIFIYMLVENIVTILELPLVIATACNTWGLLIVTVLLGYGLVEVPRSFFYASRRNYSLQRNYYKAAKLYGDLSEARGTLTEIRERVKAVSQEVRYNDHMRKYIDQIIAKYPEEMRHEFDQGQDDFEDYHRDDTDPASMSSLQSLLGKTIKALRLTHRKQLEWEELSNRILDLEDTVANSKSNERVFKSSIRKPRHRYLEVFLPTLEWYWKVWFRDYVYFGIAIVLSLMSVAIVWSESTFGIPIGDDDHLSIAANLVYHGHMNNNYAIVEIVSIVTVAYLSVCAYYTVFKIKVFNLYYLSASHSTDEYSLLFSAMLLSRLALPICLNYLYMINVVQLSHRDDSVPTTAFTKVTGEPGLIPWLTRGFYIYYPILILVLCLATLFKLGTRVMSLLGYENFLGEDEFSVEFIEEGKTLMKRERRMRERNISRGIRKNWYDHSALEDYARDSPELQRRLAQLKAFSHSKRKPLPNDESPLTGFLSKAKSFTSKQKAKLIAAKYQHGTSHHDDQDADDIRLLSVNATSAGGDSDTEISKPTRSVPTGRTGTRRGMFDDI